MLFGQIGRYIASTLPNLTPADRLMVVREVAAGDISRAVRAGAVVHGADAIAHASFVAGCEALFGVAAVALLVAAAASWRLVDCAETHPPLGAKTVTVQRRATHEGSR